MRKMKLRFFISLMLTVTMLAGACASRKGTISSVTVSPAFTPTFSPPAQSNTTTETRHPAPRPSDLPPAPPGWEWYRHERFAIAHPQAWETRFPVGHAVSFVSPETTSLVEIDAWWDKAAEPAFDLVTWVNENPARVLLAKEVPSTANAEMLGRPAVFHHEPARWGTPDIRLVAFTSSEHCFRIAFHSHGNSRVSEAEAAIYKRMLESFTVNDQSRGEVSLPTEWEQGAGLVSSLGDPPPADSLADWIELEGTVKASVLQPERRRHTYTLTTDGSETLTIDLGAIRHHFRGAAIGWDKVVEGQIEQGTQVRVVGHPLEEKQVLARYIAVRQGEQWQPWFRKAFFDLDRDEFDPALLSHYEDDVSVWLRGSLERVADLTTDSFDVQMHAQFLERDCLATGELQRGGDDFRVNVERLYVRDGPCVPISKGEEHCPSWKQLYPPVEATTTIIGDIARVVPEAKVVVLKRPVNGFVTITLAEGGQLLDEEGEPADWEQVSAGARIEAQGELGGAGTLLATKMRLVTD